MGAYCQQTIRLEARITQLRLGAIAVLRRRARLFVSLFKLRIVAALLLAAVAGAFLAADGRPDWGAVALLIAAGAASAGGASMLNEYIERDQDALMLRTRQRRPLASGAVARPRLALAGGIALIAAAALLTLPANPALAAFLLLGAFIYVVIYTLWLKPRTSWNIVIGGLAGSCAVLSGAAAVNAWTDPRAVLLAVMLFFWTPIHFWSLAMVYRDDYARIGIPMLPVRVGYRAAALCALAHGLAAGLASLLLASFLGIVYLVPAALSTAVLLGYGIRLVLEPTPGNAHRLFHVSNLFLGIIMVAVCVAAALL